MISPLLNWCMEYAIETKQSKKTLWSSTQKATWDQGQHASKDGPSVEELGGWAYLVSNHRHSWRWAEWEVPPCLMWTKQAREVGSLSSSPCIFGQGAFHNVHLARGGSGRKIASTNRIPGTRYLAKGNVASHVVLCRRRTWGSLADILSQHLPEEIHKTHAEKACSPFRFIKRT